MPHHHTWTVVSNILLALPDASGFADRSTVWRCQDEACGQWMNLHGCIKVGAPLETPEYWQAVYRQDQHRARPEAWEAARQQRTALPR